jgi:shikimate dehydrogenase
VKAAVIGHPISHSLSPAIFRLISESEQSSLAYTTEDVAPEALGAFIETLRTDDDFVGINVTIPHKETVIQFLDQVSDEVKVIGAANVVQIWRGKLIGHNTDVIGIRKTLEDQEFETEGTIALLMGAGGAARALAYVMGVQKAKKVYVYNPRSDRGHELCAAMAKHFPEVSFKAINNLSEVGTEMIGLIANCTPVGMKAEQSNFFDGLRKLRYGRNSLAFDLLYTPKNLLFVNVMKSVKVATVDGLGMLVDQALATWNLWIGTLHQGESLRDRLKVTLTGILKSREDPGPLYLTGFMGIGKSTVARELSYALGRTYFDTDKLIEEEAKQTIPEIFETQGEPVFRAHEKTAIQLAAKSSGSVVALGGGALNDPDNLRAVLDHGTLIYLKASELTLFKRLRRKTQVRPLLANLNEDQLLEKITELLAKRIPIYEQAKLQIEIKPDDTPHDTAQAVLRALGAAR